MRRGTDFHKPILSIYPAFRYTNEPEVLYVIDEDGEQENPNICKYTLAGI